MKRAIFLALLAPSSALAQSSGNATNSEGPRAFSWTDPLWPSFWMAWTPATFLLFCGIFAAMAVLTVLEIRRPGGNERKGVLGLTTTRGDRLFISLLGTTYIFLAWLGLVGQPVWWPAAISLVWAWFCFRRV